MPPPHFPRPPPHLLLLLFLLLSLIHPLRARTFTTTLDENLSKARSIPLSPHIEDVVFGLSRTGIFRAELEVSLPPALTDADPLTATPFLALCEASASFVRAPSFERRHALDTAFAVYTHLFKRLCMNPNDPHLGCDRTHLVNGTHNYLFKVGSRLIGNQLYIAAIVACADAVPPDAIRKILVEGHLQFLNPNARYPQLGWEEAVFPLVAVAALIMLAVQCVVLVVSAVVARLRPINMPRILFVALVAVALKALHAALTFVYFWGVAQNGRRESWYLYARLSVVATADVAFICVAMAMSSGYRILPPNWFVDGRSPVFLVYIGVILQILIIIAVKLMFPFRYLGVLTYTIAAGVIAIVMCIASYRNHRFLSRYAALIERAHIYVKSTPILRMRLFYIVNVVVTAVVYFFKIVSVGLWDYKIGRPDLMWGSLEIADATLLLWYTFAILPRKKSAIYLDLSNISNERLQQANTWRASQAEVVNAGSNQPGYRLAAGGEAENEEGLPNSDSDSVEREQVAAEEGTSQTLNAEPPVGPQPPWVEWQSGMSLPRPDSSTWGAYVQVTRILRRERRLVPVLPSSIILGTPSDSPDTLKLTIGLPTTGPSSVPKVFDEKGVEVAGSSFRNPVREDASSSVRVLPSATNEQQHSGQESGSGRGIRLRGLMQGFRFGSRAARSATSPEIASQSHGSESTALEPLGAQSTNPSQHDGSPMAPSVASSNASCDGVLVAQENG